MSWVLGREHLHSQVKAASMLTLHRCTRYLGLASLVLSHGQYGTVCWWMAVLVGLSSVSGLGRGWSFLSMPHHVGWEFDRLICRAFVWVDEFSTAL